MLRGLLRRLRGEPPPTSLPGKAEVLVSAIAPLIGGDALALIVALIPGNFGLRDLGGGVPVGDAAETWNTASRALERHQPITPFYLVDFFRELGLVGREFSGLALFDAALAEQLARAAQQSRGAAPAIALSGFDGDAISSARLRYSRADLAANAAAIRERWQD